MKRSLIRLSVFIFVLASLLISAIGITPVYAASSMEIVPLSLPAGWRSGYLYSVWGSGPNDVYTVGYGSNGSTTVPLLYRYNGSSWGETILPLPSGWNSGYLYGVWGSSASDVYAVGSGHDGGNFLPLVYRNDGTGWNVTSLPLPTGFNSGYLYRVWGSGASDIYAIGYGYSGNVLLPLLYHNNGSGWTEATPSRPDGWSSVKFRGVWGSGAADVYAVGSGNDGNAFLPLQYHKGAAGWDATTFSLAGWRSRYLYSVWGSSASDVYTVGYGNNGNTTIPLLYHNTGTGWTEDNPSLPTGWARGYLYDVWGVGSSDIYAVGSGHNGSSLVPLLYHNDGTGWSEASPSLPTGWSLGYLQGVWGSSADNVYVVGTGNNGSTNVPLLYHSGQGGQDLLAPGDITDFSATTGTFDGSINLSWTAPADDAGNNNSGSVISYFIKYSTSPFTSWNEGILVTAGVPLPTAPGSTQTMTISGLNPGTLYYFAIRAQDEQYNLSNSYVVADAEAKATPLGVGIYDDTHSAWIYSGTWQTFNGTGPYAESLHQNNASGSSAEVAFEGEQVSLTYLKAPGRGLIDVYIDGHQVDTINASSSGIVWQATWTSQLLNMGVHTIRFVNAGGGWTDVDAIQIYGPLTPGIYDDTHSAWSYSGTWQTFNGSGPYANTLHQSDVQDDFAEVTFNGLKVSLSYLQAPGRGLIDVYIDGNQVDTIDANSSGIVWQSIWTSQTLIEGVHTIRLVNAGGGWVDLDAIQILGPVASGIYDDTHSAWSYSTSWQTFSGSGPYANTLHQNDAADSFAEVTFEGVQVKLTYLQAPGRGLIDVYIDGNQVDTIDANSSQLVWKPTWTSQALTAGVHTIRFVNAGGGWVDLDAIQVYAPVTSGTYDDSHNAWSYSEAWQTYSGAGPYGNSLHQNNLVGSFAEVTFTGIKVSLTYLKAPGRGLIDVYIDGNKVDTIDASGTFAWQPTWISQTLSAGLHVIRFENAGGGWIDLDAIQILSSLTAAVSGTHDDSTSAWTYSGTWQTYSGSGPYAGTLHQSNVINSFAEVYFEGTQIQLTYLQAPGRGLIDVYIDGSKVDTINAYSSGIVWQPTWTSQTLSTGAHTVRFVNAGGGWIDLDAIQIQ